MFLLKKLLTALALPPVSLIILALFGLALSRRHPRSGQWLASLSLVTLLTLSLPMISGMLMRSLEIYPPIQEHQLARTQAIVILGASIYHSAPEYGSDTVGRQALERIRYGTHLQKHSRLPMLVTGGAPFGGRPEGDAMKEAIEREFGGKVRWVENASRDTEENAVFSAKQLKANGVTRIALVSHAWHLRRATELFQRQGLEVTPAPTAFTVSLPIGPIHFLPSAAALAASSSALHEWLGIVVQKIRR